MIGRFGREWPGSIFRAVSALGEIWVHRENALPPRLRGPSVQGSFDCVTASLRETVTSLRMTDFIWR